MLALALLGTLVLFWKLGQNTLANWDEGEFAQIPREMIQSGDYMTPYWGYKPKFHQPPLYVWFTVVFYRLFGITELTARAASALSGVGLLLLTYTIGKIRFGRRIALLSGFVLLTSFGFLDQARFATTDVMLTFFIYLALYAYIRVEGGDERWWYGCWIAFALAVLTKSAGGIIAPLTVGALLLVNGSIQAAFRSRHFWVGGVVAILIILPWPMYMYAKHGMAFVNDFFIYHILARTARPLEGHQAGRMYYIQELSYRFFPWIYLVPFAFTFFVWENVQGKKQSLPLLVIGTLVFGLFTLVQTKLYWYIVPLYPALSILVAAVLVMAINDPKSMAFSAVLVSTFLAVLAPPVYFNITYLSRKAKLLFMLLTVLMGGYAYVTKAIFKPLSVWLTAGVLLLLAVFNSGSLYTKSTDEVADLARLKTVNNAPLSNPLLLYSGVDWPAALFYSNRPVEQVFTKTQLLQAAEDGRPKQIILAKQDVDSLAAAFDIIALADTKRFVYASIKRK